VIAKINQDGLIMMENKLVCCVNDCIYNDESECKAKRTVVLSDTGCCSIKKVKEV